MREYCQAHPDKFDYVGSFIKQFVASGHTTTFFAGSANPSFLGFLRDMCGWEALDGMLTSLNSRTWHEPYPIVDLAKEFLYRYRPGEAEKVIDSGTIYIGGFQGAYALLEILQQAIEGVGAEDFDGQAFYDAAVRYKTAGAIWEGYPEWGFTETKRYLVDHVGVYEWSAEAGDMVRVSDWLSSEVE